MQKIPLMNAVAGMVLARDVFRNGNSTGFPVCSKNTVLTETLITRLENMDIAFIHVKGHLLPLDGDRSLGDILHDLEHRFVKVRQDPLMATLHDIYADYYRRLMGDDGGRQTE
jgi:hypothetical protein